MIDLRVRIIKRRTFEMGFELLYSDSGNHYKYEVDRTPTFESMRQFLENIKKVVNIC